MIEKHKVNIEILTKNLSVSEHPDTMKTLEDELSLLVRYQVAA